MADNPKGLASPKRITQLAYRNWWTLCIWITPLRPEGNLLITSNNAPTTIVWNPNILANTIADLGPGTYKKFVCVERGAAREDGWHLPACETIRANMTIAAA